MTKSIVSSVLLLFMFFQNGQVKDVPSASGGNYNPAAVAITGGTIAGISTLTTTGQVAFGGPILTTARASVATGAVAAGAFGYGIQVVAPTGATNNYAGLFGDIQIGSLTQFAISNISGNPITVGRNLVPGSDNSLTNGAANLRWSRGFYGPTGLIIGNGTNGVTISSSGTSPNESLNLTVQGSGSINDAGPLQGTGAIPAVVFGTGTGSIVTGSTNIAGTLTSTTTGPVSFTLTWPGSFAYAHRAVCRFANETTIANLVSVTSANTTTITASGITVTGDTISYSCVGY